MDDRTLKTFLTVCLSGAIGKTAERMNVTQSAVSRRIHSLEQELGVQLFTAEGRGIRPTETALLLLPFVEETLGTLEQIKTVASKKRSEPTALRIAATPQTVAALLAPAIQTLWEQNISVELFESGGADIAKLVLQDFCDCGISPLPAFESGLQNCPLGKLRLRAYGPKARSVAVSETTIDIAALFDQNLLVFDERFESRKILNAAFLMNKRQVNVAYEGQSSLAILALAKAKFGIAVLPSNVVSDLPNFQIQFRGRPLTIETTLIWREGNRKSEAIAALNEALLDV